MQNILSKLIDLLKKAPSWLRIILIVLILAVVGCFSWLYVSCGSLNLKDLQWQYGEGSAPPVSGTPLDITE